MANPNVSQILNKSFKPIPAEFSIKVKGLNVDFYALELLTKVKIESSDDTINETTIDFEFAPSVDSYLSKERTVPPWVFFEALGDVAYDYKITGYFINSYNYYIYVLNYNAESVKTQINQAITAFKTGLNGTTRQNAEFIRGKIRALSTALRGIDDNISNTSKKLVSIPKMTPLAGGNIHINNYSGGEDGVIKYSVKIYDKITKRVSAQDAATTQIARSQPVGFKLVSIFEMMDFFNKSLNQNQGTLSEFLMLLLGKQSPDSGNTFNVGLRTVTGATVEIKHRGSPGDSLSIQRDTTGILDRRNSFWSNLESKKINIDVSLLNSKIEKFLAYMVDVQDTVLGDKLNQAAGGGFFSSTVLRTIREAAARNGASNTTSITDNTVTISTGFYRTITEFKSMSDSLNSDEIANYFTLIAKYFGIHYREIHGLDSVTYKFYVKDLTSSPVSVSDTASYTTSELVVLDYGGLVVDFNYTIRTNNISLKELTNGGAQVTATLDQGVTLQFNISKEKIQQYANIRELSGASFNAFLEEIQKNSITDPDGFLAKFLDVVVDSSTQIKGVDDRPPGAKGSQVLTLKLRNPVPIIGKGSAIYFTTINDFDRDFSATRLSGADVKSYILPKKVAGIYIVTKVTHVLNAKENIWTQTLECER